MSILVSSLLGIPLTLTKEQAMTYHDTHLNSDRIDAVRSDQDLSYLVQQGIIKGHEIRSLAFMKAIGWKFPTGIFHGFTAENRKPCITGSGC
jgi:hypothetical protein